MRGFRDAAFYGYTSERLPHQTQSIENCALFKLMESMPDPHPNWTREEKDVLLNIPVGTERARQYIDEVNARHAV